MDVKNYDYIVVGGGSAGSVVTSKLIKDKNASVLLLEVGKSDSPPPGVNTSGVCCTYCERAFYMALFGKDK